MNRPVKITLTAFTLAMLFEACSMHKTEVGSQTKEESTLALQEQDAELQTFTRDDKSGRDITSASGQVNAPPPSALTKRLYPQSSPSPERSNLELAKKSKPAIADYKHKDEAVGGAVGYAKGNATSNRLYPGQPLVAPATPSNQPSVKPSYPNYEALSKSSAYAPPAPQASGSAYASEYAPRRESQRQYEAEQDMRCPPAYPNVQPQQPNSEEYASLYENAFLEARANPLSTFSIDVDGASYSNTRRFLQEGQLPPADAVRLEEFINYFSYDYPQPKGSDPFSIITEVATTPWNPETKLVHIGLQGRRTEAEKLPPSNLVFLIDVSGSMSSPDKLPLLKDGFDMLIDQMRPQDHISIVVYAGAAGMVLPPTSGSDKETIREALSRLSAGGSTAGGAGLMLAYQAAKQSFITGGSNRVILATDGDFNVGISNDDELVRLIEEKRKSGVFLSVLGFGTGNIKDAKMEQLADKGNGNYFYIDNINEARKVLVEKMAGTLFAIAKDVKLQIEFNPALVKSYRLVGYENRVLAAEDFNDDKKDAGELGSGTNVTALYEIVPAQPPRPRVDPLKYQNGSASRHWNWGFGGNEAGGELLTVKFRYKQPTGSTSKLLSRTLSDKNVAWQDASENFRFSAAAAGFGLILRNSQYRGNLTLDKVAVMGRGAKGRDIDGHRAEFLTLVETAKSLGGYSRVENPVYED